MELNRSLAGIARLVFNQEAAQEDVRAPYFSAGLRNGLLFANELIPVLDSEFGVAISAFNNPKDSGLFFHNEVAGRAAKVMSHPVAGCVMLYVGLSEDFEFPSRLAKEHLKPVCFEESEIPKYAKALAPHFVEANTPLSDADLSSL